MKSTVNGVLGFAGLRLVHSNVGCLSADDAGLKQIIAQLGITVVPDVGAHRGQYALRLRRLGYYGRIISFEPQAEIFEKLMKQTAKDPLWEAMPLALGDYDGEAVLNLSANSMSSSIMP